VTATVLETGFSRMVVAMQTTSKNTFYGAVAY